MDRFGGEKRGREASVSRPQDRRPARLQRRSTPRDAATSHEKECKHSQAKPEARELSDGRACLAAFPGGTIDAAPFRVVHHETTEECRFRLAARSGRIGGVIRFRTADDRCQMLREKDQDDAVQAPAHSPNPVDGLPSGRIPGLDRPPIARRWPTMQRRRCRASNSVRRQATLRARLLVFFVP